jgi:hypothetical protein
MQRVHLRTSASRCRKRFVASASSPRRAAETWRRIGEPRLAPTSPIALHRKAVWSSAESASDPTSSSAV